MLVIISWRDARTQRQRFYCTGVACKRGHTGQRYVGSRRCVLCTRQDVKVGWDAYVKARYPDIAPDPAAIDRLRTIMATVQRALAEGKLSDARK